LGHGDPNWTALGHGRLPRARRTRHHRRLRGGQPRQAGTLDLRVPRDGIFIYSPATTYPTGEPLRAVTILGEVTGDGPEPSDVIAGGFYRAAKPREIQPLPLEQRRPHSPVSRLRFGFLELDTADANPILALPSPKPH
jgi:hypothetical protein